MSTAIAAELIAEEAYQATKDYPVFDAADRLQGMLEYLVDKHKNGEADIIRACRKKAGLA